MDISYSIKRNKKSKKIRIVVCGEGGVVVKAPIKTKRKDVEKAVQDKKSWILKTIERTKSVINTELAYRDREEYLNKKEEARELIKSRAEYYGKKYGLNYNKIFIKDLRSRWGSCSLKGNLNFNYKLLFLPTKLREYIIVHEMCHLRKPDHSQEFWALVAEILPEYRELDKQIRKMELNC